jgi:hypothetical protein
MLSVSASLSPLSGLVVSEGFENPVSRHQIFQGKVEVIEIIIIIVITTTVLG